MGKRKEGAHWGGGQLLREALRGGEVAANEPSVLIFCARINTVEHRDSGVFHVVKAASPSGSHLLSNMTLATLTATAGST